jgi:hypothetical protein
MAFQIADRVKETTTTTGTGTLNLGGAVSQFQTFVAGIGNGNETYYSIEDPTGTDWEVGIGTVTDAATDTLSRDTVISSSNGGSLVNFGAGEKVVFSTQPASKTFILSSDNTAVISNINASTLTAGTLPDARFPATLPAASGENLTGLNASNLASGTLPDARFPATLPAASGENLTGLNASNLASGTLPDARFPATLPAASGENLTGLNASNLASGTLPDARFPATLPALNGSALTDLEATNIATGLVPTARLGTGTASSTTFLAGDQTYKTITADITGVTAGSGLTGGGTSGDVTLNVGAGTLIDVTADAIDVDLSELTTSTSDADGDFFVVVDSVNAQKKLTKGNINLSGFNNDSGFSTTTGTVTSVSGGNGLTGTVTTSGSLAVGAGTGIDVAADAISVDVSDFMTNGSNNRVLTATGTDAMNAEANMTFDGSTLAVTGAITATGDITAFFTSDETLKTNIENIKNPMDKVMELNGVYYDWTQEAKDKHSHLGDGREVGVIAQQVEKVLPEMVGTRDDGTKAVRYERMCALLIECVKDLQNQVNELKGL